MLSLLSVAIVCICRWTVIFKHQPLRTPQCNLDRFIITIMFFRHQGRNSNSNIIIIIIIIIIVLTLGIYTTEGTKKNNPLYYSQDTTLNLTTICHTGKPLYI